MAKHAAPVPVWRKIAVATTAIVLLGGLTALRGDPARPESASVAAAGRPAATTAERPRALAPATGSPVVDGLLTFRGNATRTYHGRGPVP